MDSVCPKCSIRITAYTRYYEANIPIEYWSLSMSNFTGPEVFKKVYENTVDNLQAVYSKGLSFSLLGQHGLGKTTIATSILKRAVEKNYNGLYITLSDLLNVIIEAPYEEKFQAKKELVQADFLVIDELDSRFFATSENTAALFGKALENIIRTRFSNRLPNIFISNSPNILEGFSGSFKDSLSSLMSNVREFAAVGKDYRKTQGK